MKIPKLENTFYNIPPVDASPAGDGARASTADGSQQERQDSLQISTQGRVQQARGMTQAELDSIREQAETAKQQAEAMSREFDALAKCLKIASRILAGDKVPREDESYLAEHQPKLYMQAMSMRRQKDDPEEHDRLTEDEQDEAAQPAAESADAPTVPEAPAPEASAPEVSLE